MPQVEEGYIVMDASIILPENDNTRAVGLPNNSTNGWYDYQWDSTKVQKLYVYFQAGGQTGVTSTQFKVPTGYHPVNNPKSIVIKIPKPANFSTINDFTIIGAFGIKDMDSQGICSIDPPAAIDGSNQNYELPFFFPPTQVKNNHCKIHFNTFGSVMRIVLHGDKNNPNPQTFTEFNVLTDVFAIKGTFDIKTAGTTTTGVGVDPKWNRTRMGPTETTFAYQAPVNGIVSPMVTTTWTSEHTYKLNNVSTDPATGEAVIYIWGYPYEGTPSYTEESSSNFNKYKRVITYGVTRADNSKYKYFAHTRNKLETKKVYTLHAFEPKGKLIFTEQVRYPIPGGGSQNTPGGIFELYNPTDAPLDLRNYKLFDNFLGQWVHFKDNNPMLKDVNYPMTQVDNLTLRPKQALPIYTANLPADPSILESYWYNNKSDWYKQVTKDLSAFDQVWFGDATQVNNQVYYVVYCDPDTGFNQIVDIVGAIRSSYSFLYRNSANNTPNIIFPNSTIWLEGYSPADNARIGERN